MIDTRVRAEDLFDSLGNEERQEIREKFELGSSALEEILSRFKALLSIRTGDLDYGYSPYQFCKKFIPKKYSAKDIKSFSLLIGRGRNIEEEENWADEFLNALMNNCIEKEISIVTEHFGYSLWGVGFENYAKNIKVKGNLYYNAGENMRGGLLEIDGHVYDGLGFGMEGGEIIVRGNAEKSVGRGMYGGKIIIEGNVGHYLGIDMRGGEIIVRGNAKSYLAFHATGGTIFVEGDIESLGEFTERRQDVPGVNIFHKGKQIVKNGRILDDRYKS